MTSKLSLAKCRDILSNNCVLNDSNLESFRDQLYSLAGIAVDSYYEHKKRIKVIPEADREALEERAAIIEFDAGFSRQEAEKMAFEEYMKKQFDSPTSRQKETNT